MIATSQTKLNPHPWCIVRDLPNMQRLVVARFHRRNDAEGYLQILRRLLPESGHTIMFDGLNEEQLRNTRVILSR